MTATDATSNPLPADDAGPDAPPTVRTGSPRSRSGSRKSGASRLPDPRPDHAGPGAPAPVAALNRARPSIERSPGRAAALDGRSGAVAPAADVATRFTTVDSPVGPLLLAAHDGGVCCIEFHASKHRVARGVDWREGDHPLLERLRVQLREYFAGTRRAFDLPLAPRGTPFQREVWRALATIPYGETVSYAQLAARVGRPNAMRAVGAANGRNPLPIVLPCHRVIGANGALTGFGGGLPVKEFLLRLEGAAAPALFA